MKTIVTDTAIALVKPVGRSCIYKGALFREERDIHPPGARDQVRLKYCDYEDPGYPRNPCCSGHPRKFRFHWGATALATVVMAPRFPPTDWVTLAMGSVMASAMDLAMDLDLAPTVLATVLQVLATATDPSMATGLDMAPDSSNRRK
ncbi:hypothetical protein MTO96_030856 [Rhipicephalus appendiculatus]